MPAGTCAAPGLLPVRAVHITRFCGPEVPDVVDVPEPVAGPGRKPYVVSTAGVDHDDTHDPVSTN